MCMRHHHLSTCLCIFSVDCLLWVVQQLALHAGGDMQGSNGFRSVQRVEYGWAVNYATVCPTDTRLAAVVGDDPTTYLTDLTSGELSMTWHVYI